jgi:hypothetical protein
MRRFLPACMLLLVCCACAPASRCDRSRDPRACLRVLFIGNSYTFVNDLPATLAELARAGGRSLETGMLANGGWTLAQHAAAPATLEQLAAQRWDYVVLQEQSQTPAVQRLRAAGMYPAVRSLVERIRQAQATPLLFQTWAHRGGWPEMGLPTYASMQAQISAGYRGIASELKVQVVPAGEAWASALGRDPGAELWQPDGSHPAEQGTYLAACVFYAALFGESPEGLAYHGNLSQESAQQLQTVAADTVLKGRR